MIILRAGLFSVRPYAKKLIDNSEVLLKSGENRWNIVKDLGRARKAYEVSSRKLTSINPIKSIKNSKDSVDSERAITKQISKILRNNA